MNFNLALFGHEGMSHSVSYRAVIETLVGVELLSKFVPDADQEETSFCAIDCDLSNDLIKALLEETLTHRADTDIACLSLL